jgi:hypothetical protein
MDPANVDLIEQMRRHADDQIERGNPYKKRADAAQPLYASLNGHQRRRFAEAVFRGNRDRQSDGCERSTVSPEARAVQCLLASGGSVKFDCMK